MKKINKINKQIINIDIILIYFITKFIQIMQTL